jgi:2,3-bisphosphoglycerate-independent phosphoglycerate mutase
MKRRVLLLILDGWGLAPAGPGNAISLANTPNFDFYWSHYPHLSLSASGPDVGLPEGQIGNSEVGHLNIGAGRVIWQDLPRISKAIKDGSFYNNETLHNMFNYCKENHKPLHLMGLVSPGGVHSHQEHLYALLSMAKHEGIHDVYVHVFTDGRDVPPKSAHKYIADLESKMKDLGVGKIATVCGRYYAMDRDNRWSRIELAYAAIVEGMGPKAESAKRAVDIAYDSGLTDEFIRPTVVLRDYKMEDGDAVLFFNLRSDRPRELTRAILDNDFRSFRVPRQFKNLYFVTMTNYDKSLNVKGIVFPEQMVKPNLATVIAENGLSQLHTAETEKYAHVTYFLDGGDEQVNENEKRLMVASPKVPTYDKKPEMSVAAVAQNIIENIGKEDFIVANFANPDMVGHTGLISAAITACEAVDIALGEVVSAALEAKYEIIITADHGNVEQMLDNSGSPHTAHTTNKVPIVFMTNEKYLVNKLTDPKLANIAPTVLFLLGIKKPSEMNEQSLLKGAV